MSKEIVKLPVKDDVRLSFDNSWADDYLNLRVERLIDGEWDIYYEANCYMETLSLGNELIDANDPVYDHPLKKEYVNVHPTNFKSLKDMIDNLDQFLQVHHKSPR